MLTGQQDSYFKNTEEYGTEIETPLILITQQQNAL